METVAGWQERWIAGAQHPPGATNCISERQDWEGEEGGCTTFTVPAGEPPGFARQRNHWQGRRELRLCLTSRSSIACSPHSLSSRISPRNPQRESSAYGERKDDTKKKKEKERNRSTHTQSCALRHAARAPIVKKSKINGQTNAARTKRRSKQEPRNGSGRARGARRGSSTLPSSRRASMKQRWILQREGSEFHLLSFSPSPWPRWAARARRGHPPRIIIVVVVVARTRPAGERNEFFRGTGLLPPCPVAGTTHERARDDAMLGSGAAAWHRPGRGRPATCRCREHCRLRWCLWVSVKSLDIFCWTSGYRAPERRVQLPSSLGTKFRTIL